MHLIAYVSDVNPDLEDQVETVIKDISDTSQANNLSKQITGLLLFYRGQFLQIIEGDRAMLNFLMYKIKNDGRHSNVEILIDEPVEHRIFSDWSMNCVELGAANAAKLTYDVLEKLQIAFKDQHLVNSKRIMGFYDALVSENQIAV